MHHCYFIVGECLPDGFETFLKAAQVEFLVFVDKRIYDICLTAHAQLVENSLVCALTLVIVAQQGCNRFAPRGKLVDYRHVEVAVNSHGQCARNRCGCHNQNMRRQQVLAPQAGSLSHAEAVLLVNNR